MKILLVDDDKLLVQVFGKMLAMHGYETVMAYNGIEALDKISKEHFDLLITDILMPVKEGIEVIHDVRKSHPDMKIIAISSGGKMGLPSFLKVAESLGAHGSLVKPFNEQDLLEKIAEVIQTDHELTKAGFSRPAEHSKSSS